MQNFGYGEPVGYRCGTILYRDLDRESIISVHGKGIMAVNRQEFRNSAIKLLQKSEMFQWQSHCFCLVSANLNAMRYFNDPRIMACLESSAVLKITPDRTANVIFEEKALSRGDFVWHDAMAMRAKQNISAVEELCIDYRPNYLFT